RNVTIFMLSIYTGFRIAEVLSLKVKDVLQFGKVKTLINLKKSNTKGKIEGRQARLNDECKQMVLDYLTHYNLLSKESQDQHLFPSHKGPQIKPRQVLNIYKDAFE